MIDKKKFHNINCVVVGPIHYNTLNVIRSLAENNIESYVVLIGDQKSNFVTASRYVRNYKVISEYSNILPYLCELAKYISQRVALIPINDKCTSIIDKNYDSLNRLFILPNCYHSENAINNEMLKSRQIEIASKCGFNVPKSALINPLDFKSDNWIIPFPCIIKPAKSINGSKSEMIICHNIDEVEKHISKLMQNHELLIQQFIPNNHFYLIAGVRCEDGTTIMPGVIEKIKKGSKNSTLGLNAFGVLIPCSKGIIDKCRQYLETIDYHGLFSFEFANAQDRDVDIDQSYFIELNLRSDGLLYFYNAGGISLPTIWVNSNSMITKKEELIKKTVYGINETVYISEFIKLTKIKDVIRDLYRTNCFSYFSLTDPHPFFKKFFRI